MVVNLKKLWIFLILIGSFLLIDNVKAQEIEFNGINLTLDTNKYPYYAVFATDNFETENSYAFFYSEQPFKITKITDTEMTVEPFEKSNGSISLNFKIYYKNENLSTGMTRLSKKFTYYFQPYTEINYISNFDIKDENDNIVYYKKEKYYDTSIGYDWLDNANKNTNYIYNRDIKEIYSEDFSGYRLTDYYSKEQIQQLFQKAYEDSKKCEYWFIAEAETYISGSKFDQGVQLICFENSDEFYSTINLTYARFTYLDWYSYELYSNIYINDNSREKMNSYFYYIRNEDILVKNDTNEKGFQNISGTNKNSIFIEYNSTSKDKDNQGLLKEIEAYPYGKYTNIDFYTYEIPNGWQEEDFYKYLNYFEYKNQKILNGSTIIFDNPPPSVNYTVAQEDTGYTVNLTYKNMTDEYYTYYQSLTLGTRVDIDLNGGTTYSIKNLNMDTILTVFIYKNSGEQVYSVTIDVNNVQLDLKNDPYILINGYNKNVKNSVTYKYMNTTEKMKCYYKIGSSEKKEESCLGDMFKLKSADYNTYIQFTIEENETIIYKKSVNLNFLENLPQIRFNSYYNAQDLVQNVDITLNNTIENDTYFYSFNNDLFTQFYETKYNLKFYNNSDLYVNIKRNDEIVSEGYLYVVYNSTSNGNPTGTGQISSIKNILDFFDNFGQDFTNIQTLFNNTWNSFKISPLIIFFLLIMTGTFIVLIIKSINRH